MPDEQPDAKPKIDHERFYDAVLAVCMAKDQAMLKGVSDYVAGGSSGLDDEATALVLALCDHKNEFCGWRRIGKLTKWEIIPGTEDEWRPVKAAEWCEVPEWEGKDA